MSDLAAVVLAAGKGTRMKSGKPKVLHRAAGRSLLGHVLHALRALAPKRTVIVSGPGMDDVAQEALKVIPGAAIAVQDKRHGTAHAVSMAKEALKGFEGRVLILYGDVPLIGADTLSGLVELCSEAVPVAVLGFTAADPHGYGRLILNAAGHAIAIREELDASAQEKQMNLCNSGIIAIDASLLWDLLPKIGNANAKGEYYLTDIVGLAAKQGLYCAVTTCEESEVAGVNDREQLAAVEWRLQQAYRSKHMVGGATLVDPSSVYFSADTKVGKDVLIEPNVFFGPGVSIDDKVHILAFSHIEGATIAEGARIGPFARLRPGAEIGENAHVGNYVEVKKARIARGAKANHLSYIGDANVGENTNIGAGTITCNFDGFEKHLTDIGAGVSIGSNTALVAPVKVGDGASIGAGSVITRNVPADSLAVTRAGQEIKQGWARRYREIKKAKTASKRK